MSNLTEQKTRSGRREWIVALVTMILVAGIAAYPSLLIAPNHWDSCLFVWQGKRMLAGDLPYRAVWDQKFPVILWVNALAAASGHVYVALYAFQTVAIGVGGWLISLMAKRPLGRAASLAAGLAYVTMASALSMLDTGNMTETYAAPAAVLCLYAMVRHIDEDSKIWPWPLVSGLGLGLAVMLRPPTVLIVAALLPLVIVARRSGRVRRTTGLAWIGGFLLVPLATVTWATSKGILGLMIRDCILDNIAYAAGTEATSRWTWSHVYRSLETIVSDAWAWHLAALFGLFIVLLGDSPLKAESESRPPVDLRGMALVWLAAAFASALPSLRFYGHYYYLTLAPLALLSGWAWRELAIRFSAKSWRKAIGAWATATTAAAVVTMGIQSDYAKASDRSRDAHPVLEMERFLSSHSRKGDTLAVFGWGIETDLLARLGWPSPTKHPHAIIYPELPGGPQRLREWTEEMLQKPPVWLVCNEREDLVQGKMIPVYGWDARAGDISRPVVEEFKNRYVEAARFPVRSIHSRTEPTYYVIYRDRSADPR